MTNPGALLLANMNVLAAQPLICPDMPRFAMLARTVRAANGPRRGTILGGRGFAVLALREFSRPVM